MRELSIRTEPGAERHHNGSNSTITDRSTRLLDEADADTKTIIDLFDPVEENDTHTSSGWRPRCRAEGEYEALCVMIWCGKVG